MSSVGQPQTPSPRPRQLRTYLARAEFIVAALITLVALSLHVRFLTNVGGLWRDETNSVNLANLSSVGEIWQFLDYDSFPMLFFGVLRAWTAVWGPLNDVALRALGGITGVAILAVLWWNARTFGARWPVLSIALVGLNPMIIRYGDSTRAYGLGMLLILLTFRSFWRIADPSSPLTARRIGIATLFALLSVQCLYYNAVLLFAIGMGAVAVALQARDWRKIAAVLSIGVFAALSLLPYVPMMRRMRGWTFLVSYPSDFSWIWRRLGEVTGAPDPLGVWLWTALFVGGVAAVGVVGVTGMRARRTLDECENAAVLPAAVLFASMTVLVGLVGYATFLNVLNYYTQPWYYITLVAFAGCALEVVFGAWTASGKLLNFGIAMRAVRILAAVALLALGGFASWHQLTIRHSNIDLLAARLQPIATKGDLILVPRWECAIPLARYYRGPAEIMTLPAIEDHRFHRYDLVLAHMQRSDSAKPVLARMEEVLRSGHRVFLVGTLPFPRADVAEPKLPPLYRDPDGGWRGAPPYAIWHFQTGQFLRAHATQAGEIPIEGTATMRIQDFEHLRLSAIAGWQ